MQGFEVQSLQITKVTDKLRSDQSRIQRIVDECRKQEVLDLIRAIDKRLSDDGNEGESNELGVKLERLRAELSAIESRL